MSGRNPLREMSGLDDDEFDRQREEAEQFIQYSGTIVTMICMYDSDMAESVVEAMKSYDTIVSIFDPTKYMQESKNVHTNAKMASILLTAKKRLTELGLCP